MKTPKASKAVAKDPKAMAEDPKGPRAIGSERSKQRASHWQQARAAGLCGGISVTVSPPDLVVDLFNFPVVEALGSF